MFSAPPSPYLVPFDGAFEIAAALAQPPADAPRKAALKEELDALRERMGRLQHAMFAQDRWALLVVFQAMDAAGKDGAIRHVFQGVNPAGLEVTDFKRPTPEDLDHDWLWRSARRLPSRGRIGVFNRSYYEEVLVVRVFPELLDAQRLPVRPEASRLWEERYASIRDHELHLARNGTAILKFWLHVSRAEQRRRFLSRLDEPEKHWKFNPGDLDARDRWDAFHAAYEAALRATSCPHAPWYAIPADDKAYARRTVAAIVVAALEGLAPAYPTVDPTVAATFAAMRQRLEAERP